FTAARSTGSETAFGRLSLAAKLNDNVVHLVVAAGAAAPTAAAAPSWPAAHVEHLALLFGRQALQIGPPVDRCLLHFAAARAQHEEVVGRSKAFVLQQTRRARAMLLPETPLHVQQLFHRRAEAARERCLLRGDDALARLEHRLAVVPALALQTARERLNRKPEKQGVQEHRRNRLVLANALIGIREPAPDEVDDLVAIRSLQLDLRD